MTRSLDGVLIKKANQQESYSRDQLVEFAKCADPITGPEYFANNFFNIQHPIRGKIKYSQFDYQRRLLETFHKYNQVIANCPRQVGKCILTNTKITIMDNQTKKKYNVPIGEFYNFMNDGKPIDYYEIK